MLRNRVLILLGGCLMMASAALADDLGYVDCNTHPEDTQIFAKARKSQDVVGTIPCGERFKVVLYGFIFSEIQTADGRVGYVYSSILTIDRGATLQSRAASDTTPRLSAASETTKIPADPRPAAPRRSASPATQASPAAPREVATNMGGSNSLADQPAAAPAPAQPAPTPSAAAPRAPASPASDATAPAADARGSATEAPAPPAPAPAQPAAAPAPTPTLPDAATVQKATEGASANPDAAPPAAAANATDPAKPEVPTNSTAAAPAQPAAPDAVSAPATPAAPPAAETAASDTAASATDTAAPAAAPEPVAQPAAPAPQPQPAAPAPQPRRVESAKITHESWEKPNPGGRNTSLLEFFGGFAYSRMNAGAGVSNNFLGGMGSFGFNIKPWLQITGDSSYNFYNVTGAKYVLYGNHYGPRFYWRRHNPFGVTPFAEALFGGSRQDVTITGPGGYTTSANGFSWKVGGGIDMRASKLFEIRLIDVDYYRTSFGTGTNQSNYWVSTGIVLRLFRSWSDQ